MKFCVDFYQPSLLTYSNPTSKLYIIRLGVRLLKAVFMVLFNLIASFMRTLGTVASLTGAPLRLQAWLQVIELILKFTKTNIQLTSFMVIQRSSLKSILAKSLIKASKTQSTTSPKSGDQVSTRARWQALKIRQKTIRTYGVQAFQEPHRSPLLGQVIGQRMLI